MLVSSASSPLSIAYINVRNLHGVIENHHHYSSVSTEDRLRAKELGEHAARYLLAHGYIRSAVETIIQARTNCTSASEFALNLSQHGLALAEGLYIWHMIHM